VRHDGLREQNCSIARTVAVLGERWTLVILRQAFLGARRFEDYQRGTGVARNILAERLRSLVEHGVLDRRPYNEHPPRFEYRLTGKGRDLYPVLVALLQWGDKHAGLEGDPPLVLHHVSCGERCEPRLVCDHCGEDIDPRQMRPEIVATAGAAADA
jgi:DNA-binding HxlR family transcriptional regulator